MRVLAAVALLAGGLVHLDLYFRYGYRDITTGDVGRAFLANGIASVLLAALLVVRRDAIIRLAGIGLAAGTLVSFIASRTLDDGFRGFTENGMRPSPQATIALVAEIVAIVVLAASFVPALRWRQQFLISPVVGGTLALALVAAGVVSTAIWANTGSSSNTYSSTSTTAPDGGTTGAPTQAVTIKGFAFDPAELDVAVGDTITWTNQDGATHTVTAADGTFSSENLGQGATFSHEFDAAGTYAYVCNIHSGMKATVVVTG
jgi:plastocyanin